MTIVDNTLVDDDDVLPPRKTRPPEPSPASTQQGTAQPAPTPEGPKQEKPAKMSPLARGTVALGGVAVAGTLLAVVGSAGGLMALVATAAGVVLVPLAWFSRNARGRRGNSRRGRRGGNRGRRTRASWWPGGLGGGGRHGAGTGGTLGTGSGRRAGTTGGGGARRAGAGTGGTLGGAGRRGTAGARSGGVLGGGRRRGGTGGILGRSGRRAGTGGILGGRRRAGTGAGWGRAGAQQRGRVPRLGQHGVGQSGAGHRGAGLPGTRIGRGVRALNYRGYGVGSSAAAGVRKPTGRAAFGKASRRYGEQGLHKPTMTGFAGRLAGGVVAGMSAGAMRFFANQARKLGRKPQPVAAQQQTQQQAQQQAQQRQVQPAAAQQAQQQQAPQKAQHPVPPPAFTQPAPGHTPAPTRLAAGTPASATSSGGTPAMTRQFPAANHAADFLNACQKWAPFGPDGKPSIWPMYESLDPMKDSIYWFTHGYIKWVANCERTLDGGLHPAMKGAMAELWNALVGASRGAEKLKPTFVQVYGDAMARRATRGRQAENV
jgi:hypothetical protein